MMSPDSPDDNFKQPLAKLQTCVYNKIQHRCVKEKKEADRELPLKKDKESEEHIQT